MNIHAFFEEFSQSEVYKEFVKNHPKSFVSHFFCFLTKEFTPKDSWEIGMYDQEEDNITIFWKKPEFVIKTQDKVLKKPESTVGKLHVEDVKTTFDQALSLAKETKSMQVPTLSGYIVLQRINEQSVWSLTFIAATGSCINIKIDAITPSILAEETFSLIEKQL